MLFSRTRHPCILVGPLSLTLLSFALWEPNDVGRGREEEGLMTWSMEWASSRRANHVFCLMTELLLCSAILVDELEERRLFLLLLFLVEFDMVGNFNMVVRGLLWREDNWSWVSLVGRLVVFTETFKASEGFLLYKVTLYTQHPQRDSSSTSLLL